MTFIEKIKKLKKQHFLTARDMMKALRVNSYTYQKIEDGERQIREDQIPILAKILQINPKKLLNLWLADKKNKEISEKLKSSSMAVSDLIKHLRRKRNVARLDMAAALNINVNNYLLVEQGKRGISEEQILIIAKMLKVNPKELQTHWLADEKNKELLENEEQLKNEKLLKDEELLRNKEQLKNERLLKRENKNKEKLLLKQKKQLNKKRKLAAKQKQIENSKNKNSLSELIRHLRKERKLSQREMADSVGISINSYKAIENRVRHIKENEIITIAEILQTNYDDLLNRWIAENEERREQRQLQYQTSTLKDINNLPLSELIQHLREERGIVRSEMARALDIPKDSYKAIEKNKRHIKRTEMVIIAKMLQPNSDELLNRWCEKYGYEQMPEEKDQNDMTLSELIRHLRTERKIGRRDMALALNINKESYKAIEVNRRRIKRTEMVIIAKMLQPNSNELFNSWCVEYGVQPQKSIDTNNITFRELIQNLRIKHKLTMRDMAAALGIYTPAYQKIETGERSIEKTQIPIIAETLHIASDDLLNIWLAEKEKKNQLKQTKISNMTLPELIKHFRMERKLKQQDMGNALGISSYTYNRIETGNQYMSKKLVQNIAEILKISPDDLFARWVVNNKKEKLPTTTDTDKMTFYEFIRYLRTEKELKLRELATPLGLTPLYYLLIEQGKSRIKSEQIPIIAKMLQTDSEELFTRWLATVGESKAKKTSTNLLKRIKQLRKEQNLIQRDMAEALGISELAYSTIEQGRRHIKEEQVPIIAEKLQTDYDALFTLWQEYNRKKEDKLNDVEEEDTKKIQKRTLLNLLKQSRKECMFTQREMGDALGISKDSYKAVEEGKRHLKKEEVPIVAKKLQINLKELNSLCFGDQPQKKEMTFLELIRHLRNERKLTQHDMGNVLKMSKDSYKAIEEGKRIIKNTEIPIIAEMLQIDTDELFVLWLNDDTPNKKEKKKKRKKDKKKRRYLK